MEQKKEQVQQGQQGSGSAEKTEQDRSSQVTPNTNVTQPENEDIAVQIGEDPGSVAGLDNIGALSGCDDVSGGSGDRMVT